MSQVLHVPFSLPPLLQQMRVCFPKLPPLLKHFRPPLIPALFLLLQCPSCKAAPGINTPFQVWSYTFPSAARKELYFQVQNCSVLVLDCVQQCSNPIEILILVIQEKSSCLCKHAQSPFATMRYSLHTVISVSLCRLEAC